MSRDKELNERVKELKNKKLTEETKKAFKEIEKEIEVENEIKDNKILFESEGDLYRVRTLTSEEDQELQKYRRTRWIELAKDTSYLFRAQWKEILKKNGIDLNEIDRKLVQLNKKQEKKLLEMAPVTSKETIEAIKEDIQDIRSQIRELIAKKAKYLSDSKEDRLRIDVSAYMAYLVLEKKEKDKKKEKWIRAFDTYKDFLGCQKKDLVIKTFDKVALIMYARALETEDEKNT